MVPKLTPFSSLIYSTRWMVTQRSFWIGLNDLDVAGDLRWTDGSPVGWAYWSPGNPSGGAERCTGMFPVFNDLTCGYKLYFICEVKGKLFSMSSKTLFVNHLLFVLAIKSLAVTRHFSPNGWRRSPTYFEMLHNWKFSMLAQGPANLGIRLPAQ